MLKQTLLLLAAWLLALAICLAACKKEPDLPDDPHVSPVNPFIGVWQGDGAEFEFRSNTNSAAQGTK